MSPKKQLQDQVGHTHFCCGQHYRPSTTSSLIHYEESATTKDTTMSSKILTKLAAALRPLFSARISLYLRYSLVLAGAICYSSCSGDSIHSGAAAGEVQNRDSEREREWERKHLWRAPVGSINCGSVPVLSTLGRMSAWVNPWVSG